LVAVFKHPAIFIAWHLYQLPMFLSLVAAATCNCHQVSRFACFKTD
jgi:hypothetical protein